MDPRAGLIDQIAAVVGRQAVTGLCSNCGQVILNDVHRCDPAGTASRILAEQWRVLIEGQTGMSRATGYAVR